jgi:prophage antirepressor-like protein
MLTVTEPGLYRLLSSKSRKPIAKRFQRWVFHQVLPSIRKTGSYSLQDAQTERMKLELELVRAKQHYQDTGYAISVSTSVATLQWLRGEARANARKFILDI